eukprot:351808-Chlamydomonas_euryale.AAC.1
MGRRMAHGMHGMHGMQVAGRAVQVDRLRWECVPAHIQTHTPIPSHSAVDPTLTPSHGNAAACTHAVLHAANEHPEQPQGPDGNVEIGHRGAG